MTEQALDGYEGLTAVQKRYLARASELPDLDPKELEDLNSAHFYDVLHEDPSYGTVNDAVNNALSRFLAHTEAAKERSKAGDTDGFLKEVGYAIHYLQDGGTPPHTEHGNYFQKIWRIPMHRAFEKGKNVGTTQRLPILKENYTPEEIPFSSLEMLFHNTALFSAQPENQVSYGNVKEWGGIQQRCYDRSVNVSKAYLNYILQFLPKTDASAKTDATSTTTAVKPEVKVETAQNITPDSEVKAPSVKKNNKLQLKSYTYNLKYTWEHKKAFMEVEKEILGHNTLSGYLHDLDKLFMYAIGIPHETAHQIHTIMASHHIKNGHVQDPLQAVIDWECARRTKPDKSLSAVEYYLTLNQRIPEIEEIFDKYGLWTGFPENK